ncbi:unnamed protein product [Macrosiphum euphorbiae]|uniref:Uncharacterized protein n=1 Tax=Macrosiphum euphorbiae TaxID=13131 RepID=A0AAV0XJN0_9HEMI|nr:unnamed protein product [Macrosiphum euphorbiae]
MSEGCYRALWFFLKYYCRNTWNLYYTPGSPPCRSVLMTAKALNFEMNLIPMDLFSGAHLQPKFLAINPQHTLPTLVKDNFVLWESRAIMVYLVETFGKEDHPLFPKDTNKRALINQRLQFDMGTLYQAFIDQYYMWIFGYSKKTEKKEKLLQEAIGFLDTFLKNSDWVAGDSMTLADISLVSSISTFEVSGVDLSRYENVSKWLQRCKDKMVGYKEINQVGAERFKAYVVEKINKTGPQTDLVTKEDIFTATEVLRNAVKAKIIGEEFSDSLSKIDEAVSVY